MVIRWFLNHGHVSIFKWQNSSIISAHIYGIWQRYVIKDKKIMADSTAD